MYLYCYIAPHSLLEWRTTVSLFLLNAENHFPDLDQKFGLLMGRKYGDAYLCEEQYERWYVSQDNSLPLGRKTKVSGTFQFVKEFQPMRHKTKTVSKMQPPPKAYLENEPNHPFCIQLLKGLISLLVQLSGFIYLFIFGLCSFPFVPFSLFLSLLSSQTGPMW